MFANSLTSRRPDQEDRRPSHLRHTGLAKINTLAKERQTHVAVTVL